MDKNAIFKGHQHVGIGNLEYRSGRSMSNPHYHNNYEIYLQIRGEKYITIENVCHHLTAGDIVLIEPYAMHLTESRDSTYCQRYVMNIYTPLLRDILSENELGLLTSKMRTMIVHLEDGQFERALNILNNIYEYSLREDGLSKKLMYAATVEIMDFISRLEAPAIRVTQGVSDNSVLMALDYVHNNYHKNITLDVISKYTSMSKSNFCLVFHKTIGETFVNYLNHVRISHAHRLVCETTLPISKIAVRTGFSSPSYMTSMLKKYTGKTPSELRKKL